MSAQVAYSWHGYKLNHYDSDLESQELIALILQQFQLFLQIRDFLIGPLQLGLELLDLALCRFKPSLHVGCDQHDVKKTPQIAENFTAQLLRVTQHTVEHRARFVPLLEQCTGIQGRDQSYFRAHQAAY